MRLRSGIILSILFMLTCVACGDRPVTSDPDTGTAADAFDPNGIATSPK